MIYRDNGETRIERDERGVRTAMLIGGGICLALAVIFIVAARETGRYVAALLPIGFGVIACALIYRNRPVIVIHSDRVGLGRVGRRIYWVPREEIDHAVIARGMLLEVILYRADGRIAQAMVCGNCNPAELRQAFTEAGITVK